MCPPGVDQTGRMSQVWALICPSAKAVLPFPPEAAEPPMHRYSRPDIKEALFNSKSSWSPYSKLAVPAPLPTKTGRALLSRRKTTSKLSRLETLPVELLSMIIEDSGLEKDDIIALGLSSTMLWDVVVPHVQASYRKTPAPWAGRMFWCQGNYATTLPEAFLSESPKDAEAQKEWDAPTQAHPMGLYRRGKCPARRFFWSAQGEYAKPVDAQAHEQKWMEAAEKQRDSSGIGPGSWEAVKQGLTCPELWPRERKWVLRNLTTKEYVDAEVLRARSEKRKKKGTIELDDVLLLRTYWSISNSRDALDIQNGAWTGHRFDIVTGDEHEANGGFMEWKDITEEVFGEAEMLRKKVVGWQARRRPS